MVEINLAQERETNFTSRQSYDIIADAVEAAYDSGFMNPFIFERALILGATAASYPDDFPYNDEIYDSPREQIKINPLDLWDEILETELFDSLLENYNDKLDNLLTQGGVWFEEYKKYAYSLRGLLDNIVPLMDEVATRADQELNQIYENGDLQEVIDIGKEWGYDRDKKQESLFVEKSIKTSPTVNLA